ncbi:DDE-type integrase/transposase/recombinase [Arthrobacter psychrolactophilus]
MGVGKLMEPSGCLSDFTKVTIIQIIDDHSRLAVATLVAKSESTESAIRAVNIAIERHGVPQRFLSDNGSAFNPTRQGKVGVLVEHLKSLGVEPMTGKPYKPTTQGKNERLHLTLQKFLRKQPPAPTIAALQAQVDAFDLYYNTERAHQHHPGNTTPQEAWDATPKATPPVPPTPDTTPTQALKSMSKKTSQDGIVTALGTHFQMGKEHIGREVYVLHNNTFIMFFDDEGIEIISHPIPPKGTNYVGNGKPQGFMNRYENKDPKTEQSTKSSDIKSPR